VPLVGLLAEGGLGGERVGRPCSPIPSEAEAREAREHHDPSRGFWDRRRKGPKDNIRVIGIMSPPEPRAPSPGAPGAPSPVEPRPPGAPGAPAASQFATDALAMQRHLHLANTISTRRFFCLPSGSSDPSGLTFGATGRFAPKPWVDILTALSPSFSLSHSFTEAARRSESF